MFKDYIDTTYVDKELKPISSIVIYLKKRKKKSLRALIKHSRYQNKNNLNLKTSYFQHKETDVGDFHPTHDLMIMDINFDSRGNIPKGLIYEVKASKPVLEITILKISYFSS